MAPLAKMTPLPPPLFIFFYFSPVPQLLEISNELLLSYSTVTAFFLANGFLHASSPPPPLLTFSSYVPTLLSSPLFFPLPFLLSLLLVFVLDRFRNPPPDTRRAQPSVQSQLCKRVFACVSWTQRKAVKKEKKERRRKRKLDTKLDYELRMRKSLGSKE